MEKKLFGYNEKIIKDSITSYCKQPHSHIENAKLSDAHFWESVIDGSKELNKKDDIIKLI